MTLSERKKKILAAVVDEYIRTAEPVGSKAIAQSGRQNEIGPAKHLRKAGFKGILNITKLEHRAKVVKHGIRRFMTDTNIEKDQKIRYCKAQGITAPNARHCRHDA